MDTTSVAVSSVASKNGRSNSVPRTRRTLLGAVPTESPLYALHPVTRLLSLIFFGVAPLFFEMPELNILWIVLVLILMKFGRVDMSRLKIYLPLIFTVAIFMFSVAIIFPGTDPTYIPFKFLGITMYYQRMFWALVSYVRVIALVFGTMQYFLTNRESDMLVGLHTLKVPFAVTYFVSLSLRGADMFMQDMITIREAEKARGLDEGGLTLMDRVKLYAMFMIPLFTLALRRADEISNALFVRGYTFSGKVLGGGKRVNYASSLFQLNRIDWILCSLQIVGFLALMALEFGFGTFRIGNSPLNVYFLRLLSNSG